MNRIPSAVFMGCRVLAGGVCLLLAASAGFGADAATLVSITVKPHKISIVSGTSQQYTAIGNYSDGRKRDITLSVQWKSSNTNFAIIASNGEATGVAAGQSKITARLQTIRGSASLTVTPAPLVSITVTPPDTSIVVGTNQQFTATGYYSDGNSQDLTSAVSWNSSATDIVTFSGSGLATAVPGGVPAGEPPVPVTITAAYGIISGDTSLTVTNNLTSIVVNPGSITLEIDAERVMAATGVYQDASTLDLSDSADWSSDTGVVKVDRAVCAVPLATGIALGSATITAAKDGISGTASATVTDPIPSAGIDPSFFGMTIGDAASYPPADVPIGAIGHPTLLAWDTIEHDQDDFEFGVYDKFVDWAAQNNVPITMTFGWTPEWATDDKDSCTAPPDHPDYKVCTGPPSQMKYWTDFVQAVVSHYSGIKHAIIPYYELWNEANSLEFWSGKQPELVLMAQAAYPIVHQNPNSMLLTPSTTGPYGGSAGARDWIRSYLTQCGRLYADGGTFHGYLAPNLENGSHDAPDYPFPEDDQNSGYGSIAKRTQVFRTVFDQNGLKGKPMFDTEGSWGRANITDPSQQVAWLARWYLIQAGVKADNGTPAVQSAYWFAWGYSNPKQPEDQQWGLISDAEGNATEAGLAYGYVYKWLVGATVSPCTSSANVWTCALTGPNGYQGLAVWYYSIDEKGSLSYVPDPKSNYVRYQDLYGNVTQLDGTSITIGPQPILLETGAR